MLRHVATAIALLSVLLVMPVRAATGRASAPPAPHAKRATSAKSATAAKARTPELPRTLADVHIDGETPVPQVQFITARLLSGEREDDAKAWIETLIADIVPEKHDKVRSVVHAAIEQRVPILRQLQMVPA